MVDKELTKYVKKHLKKGYAREELKTYLEESGYGFFEIRSALNTAETELKSWKNTDEKTKLKTLKKEKDQPKLKKEVEKKAKEVKKAAGKGKELLISKKTNKTLEEQRAEKIVIKQTLQEQGIKYRNPFLVLLFTILTFGIYGIYWVVSTTKELNRTTKSAPNPWWFLFFLIPIVNIVFYLIYYYKYSNAIEELTCFDKTGMFLLWILVSPAAMVVS